MTTPDYPDWTQPVASTEQVSADLLAGSPLVIGTGGGQGTPQTVDTSGASSVDLAITLPGTAVGTGYILRCDWLDGGVIVASESVSFHSSTSYGQPYTGLAVQLPVLGQQLQLSAVGDLAGNLAVGVRTSSRSIPAPRVTRIGGTPGTLLSTGINGTINPSGALLNYYLPPVSRAVQLNSNFAMTSGTLTVTGLAYSAGATATVRKYRASTPDTDPALLEVLSPLTGLFVQFQNNGAAAATGRLGAWDVS